MDATGFSAPYRHWVIDDFADPELVRAAHNALPPPDWAGWVRYTNELERKRTCRDLGLLGDPVHQLFSWLNGLAVVQRLADLARVEGLSPDPTLHGAGVHISDPGDFLQVHGDYEIHPHAPDLERRLNLILPLHPEWRLEWGGELLLCDPMGNAVKRWPPAPGSAIIFECGNTSFHGVRATTADAPVRVTAAVYYLAPIRPTAHRKRAMFFPNRASPGIPHEVK